jgi:hypothetical protein
MRQLASRKPASDPKPLVGMFALGLLAGAIGSYAVTHRPQMRRLANRALAFRNDALGELARSGRIEAENAASVTTHRSNYRRKATLEVT